MTDEEIFEKLRPLCAQALSVHPADVTRDADLRNDLGADSLDLAELAMVVEDAFGPIVADGTGGARTVADVVGVIKAGLDGGREFAGRAL